MVKQQSNFFQAFWVGMGSLSTFALALVSAAILSRYFDKAEYGTYKQILYVYNTLLIIFSAGLPKVFAYFLPRYSISQGRDIVWKITKVLFFAGLIFSIFLFAFSDLIAKLLNNPELSVGLKIFSPIPMLLLPTLGIEGIFSTYKKTIFIAVYNTVTRILMLVFIVTPVIYFEGTYRNAIYGWIVVSVFSLFIAYYFKGIPFKGITQEKSLLSLKEVFSYSVPIAVASLSGIALKSADQFYISRYYGAEVFAEYSNGFIQIPLVGMITGATSLVLMPQFAKIIHDKSDIEVLLTLWRNALIKSASLIYPMVIFFIFTAKDLVVLMYSDLYKGSTIYFQIAMLINLFNIVIFAPLLFSLGETRFYAKIHFVFAILIWVGGYLVVNLFSSPILIAILSTINSILIVIVALLKSSIKMQVPILKLIPIWHFFKIIIVSFLAISVILYVFGEINPDINIMLRISILALVYSVLVFTLTGIAGIDYKWLYNPFLNRIIKNAK